MLNDFQFLIKFLIVFKLVVYAADVTEMSKIYDQNGNGQNQIL